jgi:5-methylcytosine-specific restriction protein A
MKKLKTLGPRIATLNTQRARSLTTETVRITGSRLQAIRERILRRDNGLCQCEECKAAPLPRLASVVDHVVPLWEGGAESDENRQSLHPDCHARKSADEARRRAGGGEGAG